MAEEKLASPTTTGAYPKVFVNLPIKDLAKSTEFFTKTLGFKLDKRFSNENAACIVISDHIYAMLLVESFFKTFTKKEIANAHKSTEAIVALEVESKERVDELVQAALAGGGLPANDTDDSGFMYGGSFHDPDGHLWEVFWMNSEGVAEHVAKEKERGSEKAQAPA